MVCGTQTYADRISICINKLNKKEVFQHGDTAVTLVSTLEAEAGGLRIQGQLGLNINILSQNVPHKAPL